MTYMQVNGMLETNFTTTCTPRESVYEFELDDSSEKKGIGNFYLYCLYLIAVVMAEYAVYLITNI